MNTSPLSATESEILLRYQPLVEKTVGRVLLKLPLHVDVPELYGAGLEGLIAAVRRFDPEQSATFENYAAMRVRGAILDRLRSNDPAGRRDRTRHKKFQAAKEELTQTLRREVTDAEVAKHMGIPTEDIHRYRRAEIAHVVSIHEPVPGHDNENFEMSLEDLNARPAHEHMENEEALKRMWDCVATLTDIEKKIIKLYYFDGYKLWEIAEEVGRTESRVCQIVAKILKTLRRQLSRGPDALLVV